MICDDYWCFFVILGCPEALFLLHSVSFLGALGPWQNSWKYVAIVKLAPVVVKNRSEQNMRKVFKNGSASQAGKTVPGAVGPLKREENKTIRQPDTASNTPWRAWRHGGWYIYIYIFIYIWYVYIYIYIYAPAIQIRLLNKQS